MKKQKNNEENNNNNIQNNNNNSKDTQNNAINPQHNLQEHQKPKEWVFLHSLRKVVTPPPEPENDENTFVPKSYSRATTKLGHQVNNCCQRMKAIFMKRVIM